ncbi:MAG: serine hydrolase domain-containing protein, partial [Anaerolineaceae bacterium]
PPKLAAFAAAEMARLQIPGLAVAVLHEGQVYADGFGVTNVNHPLPVSAGTLFQIGSTSKTFTATALMQLVEEGRVDLEAPLRRYLPGFALQSGTDAERLTVRHLVTHHGGFVGDYFRDTGRGDDALRMIVAKMKNSAQLVPVGTAFSYSNAGFYVLGHLVATLRGQPFESVIRERILGPLGMDHTTYFAEEAIVHAVAAGHIVTNEGPKVATPWNTPRSIAPGGGITSTVLDQIAYAAMHLTEGRGAAGEAILKPESATSMQSPLAIAGSMCESVGVSWMLDGSGKDRMVKHGGATNGHMSSFELFPGHNFAVTVLTNSDTGRVGRNTIADACKRHFIGWREPVIVPLQPQPDLREYAGSYQSVLARLEVTAGANGLIATDATPERGFAERRHRPLPADPVDLVFVGPDATAVVNGSHAGERSEFLRGADGRIEWMRWDGRIARRVE